MPHSDRLYSLGTIENDLIYFVKFVKFPRRETLFFSDYTPPTIWVVYSDMSLDGKRIEVKIVLDF